MIPKLESVTIKIQIPTAPELTGHWFPAGYDWEKRPLTDYEIKRIKHLQSKSFSEQTRSIDKELNPAIYNNCVSCAGSLLMVEKPYPSNEWGR